MQTGRPNDITTFISVSFNFPDNVESMDFGFEDCWMASQSFLCALCEDCYDSRSSLIMLSISCKKASLICQVNPPL